MPRIRTIKPEILEDAKTANLTHEAWRLFVSMIALADDHGGLRGDPAWLDGQVFWGSPVSGGLPGLDDALEELATVNLVSLYEVRGQRYAQITNWNKHQKVDHPSKPRLPRFDDPEARPVPVKPDRIYFIQGETSREIRIGVSRNPSRTLARLSEGSREAFRILLDVPGTQEECRDLCRMFATSRVRGDWYREASDVLDKIAELHGQLRILDNPRETLAKPSTTLASHTSDLDLRSGPPTVDPERDLARARAILPSTVPSTETDQPQQLSLVPPPLDASWLDPAWPAKGAVPRLIHTLWSLCAVEHAKLKADGIDSDAPAAWGGQPGKSYPPMAALIARVDEMLVRFGGDIVEVEKRMRHRVAVAFEEARDKLSGKFVTPAWMWRAESFAIAVDMSLKQARRRTAAPELNVFDVVDQASAAIERAAAARKPPVNASPSEHEQIHAWTGPRDGETAPSGMLLGRVPGERWPYGPPAAHEPCCNLFPRNGSPGGLFCDCAASAADDVEQGVRA
jgi:hypothetical protein